MDTNQSAQAEQPGQQTAITVPAGTVIPSVAAMLQDFMAFEAINQGQPVALIDPTLGLSVASGSGVPTVRLADASVIYKVIGRAATAALAGQPIKVITSDPALGIGGVVAGDVLYLGVTSGALTITYADLVATKFVAVIGIGIGAGKLNMKIVRADVAK